MKWGQVTIAGLCGVVFLSSLGMAALRSPSVLVAQAFATLALTCLMIATLAAIFATRRALALGFAVFGWIYLVLVFGPGFSDQVAPWLLSSRLLDEAYGQGTSDYGAWEGNHLTEYLRRGGDARFLQFRIVGHSLFAIGHGIFGAVLASLLVRNRRTPAEEAAP